MKTKTFNLLALLSIPLGFALVDLLLFPDFIKLRYTDPDFTEIQSGDFIDSPEYGDVFAFTSSCNNPCSNTSCFLYYCEGKQSDGSVRFKVQQGDIGLAPVIEEWAIFNYKGHDGGGEQIIETKVGDRHSIAAQNNFIRGVRVVVGSSQISWWSLTESGFGQMVFFSIIAFFLIWLSDGLNNLSNFFFSLNRPILIKALSLFGFYCFLCWGFGGEEARNTDVWWTYTSLFLILFPAFMFFHLAVKRIASKLNFTTAELLKYWTVFLFTFTLIFVLQSGSQVYHWYFHDNYIVDSLFRIELIFLLAFVNGNVLNNLRKNFFQLRRGQMHIKRVEKRALQSEAELDALQASVNPHFLYNALNSIASLAPVDADKTAKMAMALSDFYRYTTNREEAHLSTVGAEIEMIETYLQIEKIRFEDRLKYEIYNLETDNSLPIPRFLLQPLVENAIKYGYNSQTDQIEVEIEIKRVGSDLIIKVQDNGKPFPEQLEVGYGLRSVRKKLKLLFPNQHELSFVNAPEKFVEVELKNIA